MTGSRKQARGGIGDNGGPALDPARAPEPESGKGEIGGFYDWRFVSRRAWRRGGPEIALSRLARAEKLGLTYEEYTLEILERSRHVGEADVGEIKARRAERRAAGTIVGQSLKGKRLTPKV